MHELRLEVAGVALHVQAWAPQGKPRGALVLVHGFNSSLGEFGPLPEALATRGYLAVAFDQRGYGRSGGEAGRTSVEAALEDIGAVVAHLRDAHPGLAIGIVGHSLGGAYAVAALAAMPELRCGVVAHPVDRLFDELKPHEKAAYHLIGRWTERRMAKGRPAGTIPYKLTYPKLFVSRDAARKAKDDGFLLGRVSLANYRPALTMSASQWARGVRQPVLVIASEHDRAVKPEHTRKVYDALAGPKELVLHHGGHSCFRDLDGARLATTTADWFDMHLKE